MKSEKQSSEELMYVEKMSQYINIERTPAPQISLLPILLPGVTITTRHFSFTI